MSDEGFFIDEITNKLTLLEPDLSHQAGDLSGDFIKYVQVGEDFSKKVREIFDLLTRMNKLLEERRNETFALETLITVEEADCEIELKFLDELINSAKQEFERRENLIDLLKYQEEKFKENTINKIK